MSKSKKRLSIEERLEQALVPKEERPYELCFDSKWVKISDIAFVTKLAGFEYTKLVKPNLVNEGIPLFKGKNVQKGGLIYEFESYIPKEISDELIRSKLSKKCLLTPYVGTIGNIAIFDGNRECHLGSNVGKIEINNDEKMIMLEEFLLYYLRSSFGYSELTKHKKATAQESISITAIRDVCVPLIPIERQRNVVDRIESLFEKIDKAQELIEEARDGFEKRKEAILAKAFRGELTAKWREENQPELTQTEYYESVIKRRYEIVETKRELNDLNNLIENHDYRTHELPSSWINMKSNMICYNINCGSTPTKHISNSEVIPFLKVYNIVNNEVDFDYKPQFIPEDISQKKLRKSVLKPHDVIMNIVGPPLRKIAMIPDDYSEWNMNQAIVRFRPTEVIKSKYLYYALINKETLNDVISETRGMVGQSNISVSQSRSLTIPLAPLDEQKEIVKILDRVISDEKEIERLTTIDENIKLLKKSILAKAFRGELGTNDPNEESSFGITKGNL